MIDQTKVEEIRKDALKTPLNELLALAVGFMYVAEQLPDPPEGKELEEPYKTLLEIAEVAEQLMA